MRNIIIILFINLFACFAFGQIKVVSNGDTGIGSDASSPSADLHIFENKNSVTRMRVENQSSGSNAIADLYMITGASKGFALQKFGSNFSQFTWNGINLSDYARFRSDSQVEGLIFTTGSSKPLIFGTSDSERMRILPNGNIGIGTTSPTSPLQVAGDIKATGFVVVSDKRLKDNIQPLNYGLNEILQLEPVTYTYKNKSQLKDNNSLHFGLLAQEVQKVMPELVEAYSTIEYSDDINKYGEDNGGFLRESVQKEETYFAIKDSHIKFALINAIKDQQSIIDQQETRIAQLEDLVNKLIENEVSQNTEISVTLESYEQADLAQNEPNPFNGITRINYIIPSDATTSSINIFDMNGRLLKTVDLNHTGKGTLNVNADNLPSGTYSYQLIVDGQIQLTKNMILSK